jgi:hypothetical protein
MNMCKLRKKKRFENNNYLRAGHSRLFLAKLIIQVIGGTEVIGSERERDREMDGEQELTGKDGDERFMMNAGWTTGTVQIYSRHKRQLVFLSACPW